MGHVDMMESEAQCEFHHVQMYVDALRPIAFYKELEAKANGLANQGSFDPFSGGMRFLGNKALPERIEKGRAIWNSLCRGDSAAMVGAFDPCDFSGSGQDIVEQLIIGLGWRLTAAYEGPSTQSVLVVSQDPKGVKFVVTAPKNGASSSSAQDEKEEEEEEQYPHFSAQSLFRFQKLHNGLQGISVLGFEILGENELEQVVQRYKKLHPNLLCSDTSYEDARAVRHQSSGKSRNVTLGSMRVVEAYAYYFPESKTEADKGTVIRFVHRSGSFASKEGFGNPQGVLPGLEDVPATFDGTSIPAYADHWVSNVVDRLSFLTTLEDVLGFTPKVDFNAGVVAAGRARIESTVTGNDAGKSKEYQNLDQGQVLRDQSQIYLPINNALSEVGHVHFFLEQYGQGVQHLASRVKDLVGFIERVNNYRAMTGRGFSFLNIPRSYYGRLTIHELAEAVGGDDKELAQSIFDFLVEHNVCTMAGVVKLDVDAAEIEKALSALSLEPAKLKAACAAVLLARYSNLFKLLRDHFDENTYLQIVKNKILVDVQGNDVLFQIFTCNILQRKAGEEAPFLEFIQRVCSQKVCADGSCAPIKPGCGGFGIRNFLTLFLSIEVSKAMNDIEVAARKGDKDGAAHAQARVDLFTRQLEESNPILTEISDAMTAEGDALDELASLQKLNKQDPAQANRIAQLEQQAEEMKQAKIRCNGQLQALSDRYGKLMIDLDKSK